MQASIKMFFKPRTPGNPDVADGAGGLTNDRTEPESPSTTKRPVDNCPRTPKRHAQEEDDGNLIIKRQAMATPTASPFRNDRTITSSPRTPKISLAISGQTTPKTPTTSSFTPKQTKQVRTPLATSSPSFTPRSNNNIQANRNPTQEGRKHPHLSYDFLYPPKRRDIHQRKPDHPEYDERTLFVPEHFLNSQTPALRQWWIIKQRNMDTVLFFKMGKFYELFNQDAVIGVENLEINFMKGDGPAHAGFPEISFDKYSEMLIARGFKVARIEQTETPEMMEDRCRETGKRSKFDKVVNREICRVTSRGTQMLGLMESFSKSAGNHYLLAIYESKTDASEGLRCPIFGVCFIDVTISKLYLGQFEDDNNLSRLNILLAHHSPTEVVYERNNLQSQTHQALTRTGAQMTMLKPKKEFWPIDQALSHLKVHNIFLDESNKFEWPSVLHSLFVEGVSSESLMALEPKEEYRYALNSFGAIVYYLQSQLISEQVLRCTSFELYHNPLMNRHSHSPNKSMNVQQPPMIMDHIALRNLEIFENSSGGTLGTLFETINDCKTHFGQRLLRNWICSPLRDVIQINNRLDAVGALVDNDNASLMNEFVYVLKQTPDLERMLSKVKSQCFKSESDTRAVMFDSVKYSKAKINSFLNLLQNFKRLRKFIISISNTAKRCDSAILKRLLSFTSDGGLFPDYGSTLDYFDSIFNQELARQEGKIIPAPGVDKDHDSCQSSIDDIKNRLDGYLEEQRRALRCPSIVYFGTGKNRYQIQVPESHCYKVPSDYRIETTRKGFKRYLTPVIDKLFRDLTVKEEEMKRILDRTMSSIFEQFSKKIKLWSSAIECMAILDVLQSIASFVRSLRASDIDVCRPDLLESEGKPVIDYVDGRHPSLVKLNDDFIPNNLILDDRSILLSGANMGGKSTLMRQTALLVILAQIGSFVPASRMRLSPVDRIFSRLGASDRILDGESTFYIELVETSAIIRCATSDSLILLDELGRGTSTYDGTAIAYSVLEEISQNIKCRCLFSTHYHTLVRDFSSSDKVRLAYMACRVNKNPEEDNSNPHDENITFLYKIAEGPEVRSYGFNVARLAGIENEIVREAVRKADELELHCKVMEALQKVCITDKSLSSKKQELKNCVLAEMTRMNIN